MINRLPAEELLGTVRHAQAEWRSAIRREQAEPEPDSRQWWTRLPERREARRSIPDPGRSSLAGI